MAEKSLLKLEETHTGQIVLLNLDQAFTIVSKVTPAGKSFELTFPGSEGKVVIGSTQPEYKVVRKYVEDHTL